MKKCKRKTRRTTVIWRKRPRRKTMKGDADTTLKKTKA